MDLLPLLLGGGGLLGLASFLLSLRAAHRETERDELLQWRVQVVERSDSFVTVFLAPVGGEVRNVRIAIGLPPQRFDPATKLELAEWPPENGIALTTHLPGSEQDDLFARISYRSVQRPRWTHEMWVPVFDGGELALLHQRQSSAPSLMKWWRWLRQAPVLPVQHGLSSWRLSEARRAQQLRRAIRAGGKLPDPRTERAQRRKQRHNVIDEEQPR